MAGYFGRGFPPDAGTLLLQRMNHALRHRGPDERGILVEGGAGLAHVRLSIVGISDGQQPMSDASGRVSISFNGEIFNHVELRGAMEARGRRFRTNSDTEVILHLYDEMGPDCVTLLNGDFAFAILDDRRRRMVLARDRMGVRPLFYTALGDTLFFASEIKALLEVPGLGAELDPFALDQVFTFWAPTPPRTAFRNVYELPPGHIMVVTPEGNALRRYWQLSFPDRYDAPDVRTEATIAEELFALLEDATRIRLRADVPVGAYLSGGFDSSLVCALAARALPDRLASFSVTFDSAEHDESREQAIMVRALRSRHAAVACRGRDIAEDFPEVIRHTERPILRTGPAPLYRLAGLVRERGMKVVLTGEGADEVFAGYDIFKEARVRSFCARQPASRIRPHLLRRLYPYLPGLRSQSVETLASFFGASMDPASDPLYAHRPRMRNTAAAKLFFSDTLKADLRGYDAAAELVERLPAEFRRWHPLHQAQYIESTTLLPDYILSSQGDRMAMAHGVEGRFPFLDHRVIEFAARIPPGLKLKGLVEKHILRRAARDILPAAIGARTKQPYRAPESRCFFESGAPSYVSDLLAPLAIKATGCFNSTSVLGLAEKCRRQDGGGFRDNAAFIGILSTQLWHQAFAGLKASPARPPPAAPRPILEEVS